MGVSGLASLEVATFLVRRLICSWELHVWVGCSNFCLGEAHILFVRLGVLKSGFLQSGFGSILDN